MSKKNTINWKDIAVRSAKTFVQGALAYATINFVLVKDRDTFKTFAVGLLAAGFSAVWNITIEVKKTK